MDYRFPRQLFPTFCNNGPPTAVLKQCCGKWGSYDRVLPLGGSGPLSSWTFTSRHRVRGETWRHIEPVPVPLLSPKYFVEWSPEPPDPMDFTKHMENFFEDHCQDAFGGLVEALGEDFSGAAATSSSKRQKKKKVPDEPQFKKRPAKHSAGGLRAHSAHLSDVVHSIPPKLLASLLHEELEEQRERALFFEGATGGALAFVPFGDSGCRSGCLLYPGSKGLDCLNFHRVELQHQQGLSPRVDAGGCDALGVQLKAPIRQISTASHFNECCVAVRSDHRCGVWRFGEEVEPRLLQVVDTRERATCVSSSPHVLGEVLVVSESGAAKLWSVGRGIQSVREEEHNLYFDAKSPWRWCHFSAHPRVVVYADRTGVELTDVRVKPARCNTLFRVGSTCECCRGERVILSQYLGDVHSFHHLVTTQFSAYIMDERFPTVPMLKWDHMTSSPPMFCHVVPASSGSTKLLLGSHSSQEVTMLQYSGGAAEACHSLGPPLALHRPRHSLKHLPVQLPHRFQIAKDRLSSPAAGLTCIQQDGEGDQKCICVLQLTEAGDIFYQVLELQPQEDPVLPEEERRNPSGQTEPLVSDTSSDEDIVGPTQEPSARRLVPETPERERRAPSDPESDPEPNPEPELESDSESEPGPMKQRAPETKAEGKISSEVLTRWRHWLQKLWRKSRRSGGAAKAPALRHIWVGTGPKVAHRQEDQDLVQSFGQELSEIMARRSLLVATEQHQDQDQDQDHNQALLDALDTDAWSDPLSQRLTATWRGGEAAWQAWWRDELGLDRQEKAEALLRRRRRQKAARRASGRRHQLPSSFSSSVTELSDWSSQGAWSEHEGSAPTSPQGPKDPISPQGPKEPVAPLPPTPSSQRTVGRLVKDYLSSVCTPQDDVSQQDASCSFLDQEQGGAPLSRDVFSSQSFSQSGPRVDLSQDAQVFPRFSQSLSQSLSQTLSQTQSQSQSQSQSSQSRTRLSQASQPTRKKSRMGF